MQLVHTVGHNVRVLRERKGLTQSALAELCDLGANTISRIERGSQGPSFVALDRLAAALDVPAAALFLEPGQTIGGTNLQLPDDVAQLQDRLLRALAVLRDG